MNLGRGVLAQGLERSLDPADQSNRITLATTARATNMQHEHACVVPGVTDGHVRPTSHGATHEGNQICCDGVGVGFGGVAACAGHVAHQSIQAGRIRPGGVAVVVEAVVICRVGQDVEVAFHC